MMADRGWRYPATRRGRTTGLIVGGVGAAAVVRVAGTRPLASATTMGANAT
jgi:hypothetical protein